ncbi:MAG: DinB family protein [Chitinophagaceae bacterium]
MDRNTIIAEAERTTKELLNSISFFTQEQFNEVPFPGSWTPGQVAEHVFKSESGIPKVFTTAIQPTTRDPEEKAPEIRSIFLDFSIKMQSPDFILPSSKPKDRATLLAGLEKNRQEISCLLGTLDLTATCTSFPLPQMGELTRYEWATFIDCHARRHIHQLKNIREKLH